MSAVECYRGSELIAAIRVDEFETTDAILRMTSRPSSAHFFDSSRKLNEPMSCRRVNSYSGWQTSWNYIIVGEWRVYHAWLCKQPRMRQRPLCQHLPTVWVEIDQEGRMQGIVRSEIIGRAWPTETQPLSLWKRILRWLGA